jgi:1,4-alpha-glucan branching enzyme
LADDPNLKYRFSAGFDRDMIRLAQKFKLLDTPGPNLIYEHDADKIIIFERAGLLLVFNFHPNQSYSDYRFEASPGKYKMIFDTDGGPSGGHSRLTPDQVHLTRVEVAAHHKRQFLSLYLPARTAQVLQRIE